MYTPEKFCMKGTSSYTKSMYIMKQLCKVSGCENSAGTFEKQAPGLAPGLLRSGDERTNHEAIGSPLYEYYFF